MSRGAFPILFVTSNRIGDAVLSSGLIKRLSDEIPNARFTVVAGPVAAPLFEEVPSLDRIIPFAKSKSGGHWFDLWRQVRNTAGAWWSICAVRACRGSFRRDGALSGARPPARRCTRSSRPPAS